MSKATAPFPFSYIHQLNTRSIFSLNSNVLETWNQMNWADCRINGIVFILVGVVVDLFNTA